MFDRWVHAENLCSILNLVYFDSWSWQSFVSPCDVFNCLFPLNVQSEIQLLSRVFCYSWLVCLLGFWLRNTSLVKVGNPISDGIVFVFHLAWCVRRLKSLKRFWPYLMVFSASRMVSLSNYCIWCLFCYISNLMKSSVVYAAIWFIHVCKIWDNDLTERGVCKTRTGYLRMADADGKMRIEKCGWKKKTRITKKLRRKKTRNADNKKKKNK